MGKIYITRHGETLLNTLDCFQGSSDAPETYLTQRGIHQAELLGRRLQDTPIGLILSSPLKRAVDTASIIRGDRDIPLLTDDGLLERSLGVWEGRTHDSVRKELGLTRRELQLTSVVPEGGESTEELERRAKRDFLRIAREHIDEDILVVTHCVILQPILSLIKGTPLDTTYFIPQASISLCTYDGQGFTMVYEADTSHLKEGIL